MIRRRTSTASRNNERGVTMILVALAILSMLGMVALAIDVITLYSARSETQRAADSAAMAAAKMLVDMGVTTDPSVSVPTAAQIDAATKVAKDVAIKATVAGRAFVPGDVTLTFPGNGSAAFNVNPRVTVTVQKTSLPTFFSRIWNRATVTVRATATAEGFNPSNASSVVTPGIPVVARCVKPFMIPNCDPGHSGGSFCGAGSATFFDPTTGAITNPGTAPTGVIGEDFDLFSSCPGPGCNPPGPPTAGPGPNLQYYPVTIGSAINACPSSCGGGTNFEEDIECCNPTPISCGTTATAPVVNQLTLDAIVFPETAGGPAQTGIECLIHQRPGSGQDVLDASSFLSYPLKIQVGNNHPLAGTVLSANDLVTTSDSLVTIPVYDPTPLPPPGNPPVGTPVNIVGFLQVFIDQAFPGGGGKKPGQFHVYVVNVLGCGSSATGTAIAAGAAMPVRLVQ